jgi:hypothetical protein
MLNIAQKVVKFTVAKHNSDDHIKKGEMSWTCGTYGGEEKRLQGFGGETRRKKKHLGSCRRKS